MGKKLGEIFDNRKRIAIDNIKKMEDIDCKNKSFYEQWLQLFELCSLKKEDDLLHYDNGYFEAFHIFDDLQLSNNITFKFVWFYDIVRMNKMNKKESIQLEIYNDEVYYEQKKTNFIHYVAGEDKSYNNYDKIVLVELPQFFNGYSICDGNHKISKIINDNKTSCNAEKVTFRDSICCLADSIDFLVVFFLMDLSNVRKGEQPRYLPFIQNRTELILKEHFRLIK